MAAPALAQDLVIRDFVGTVTITTGPASLDVLRKHPDLVTDSGGRLLIDGNIDKPEKSGVCGSYRSWWGGGGKSASLDDFAALDVTLPEGATLSIENSYVRLDASDTALSDAEVELAGCFDAALGDMLEADIGKSGSGALSIGSTGTLKLGKSGSGDVTIEDVGTLDYGQSGSGDVSIGRIGVSGKIGKSGSGDVRIGTVQGPLTLAKSGSGRVRVDGGSITALKIGASGSGGITVDADVVDASIAKSGSGDVRLARVSGRLEQSTSGSARITVGARD